MKMMHTMSFSTILLSGVRLDGKCSVSLNVSLNVVKKRVSSSWVKSKPTQDILKDNEDLLVGMFTIH